MAALSLRRLRLVYKQTAIERGAPTKRELILQQDAFYSGARGVLMVLNHLAEHGEIDEIDRTLAHLGRQIGAIRGRRPRARH